jgi:hypothetical protein
MPNPNQPRLGAGARWAPDELWAVSMPRSLPQFWRGFAMAAALAALMSGAFFTFAPSRTHRLSPPRPPISINIGRELRLLRGPTAHGRRSARHHRLRRHDTGSATSN